MTASASVNYDASAESLELRQNPRYFTAAQLRYHDGTDPSRCLLLAIKGVVLDVSSGASFYGVGAAYNIFAGRDASHGFALTSLRPEHAHAELSGCSAAQLQTLDDWAAKLGAKYPHVGSMVPSPSEAQEAAAAAATRAERDGERASAEAAGAPPAPWGGGAPPESDDEWRVV